jgi:hypothetical protein
MPQHVHGRVISGFIIIQQCKTKSTRLCSLCLNKTVHISCYHSYNSTHIRELTVRNSPSSGWSPPYRVCCRRYHRLVSEILKFHFHPLHFMVLQACFILKYSFYLWQDLVFLLVYFEDSISVSFHLKNSDKINCINQWTGSSFIVLYSVLKRPVSLQLI